MEVAMERHNNQTLVVTDNETTNLKMIIDYIIHNKKEILKKSPALFGCVAGLPYLRAGRSFAGDSELLKVLFSYGIVTGVACLTTWALLNIIDDISSSTENTNLKKVKPKGLKKALYNTLTITLGLITALPSAYIGYRYNEKSIVWSLIACGTDTILYSYSIKQLSKQIIPKMIIPEPRHKIMLMRNIKNGLTFALREGLIKIVNLPKEERNRKLLALVENENNLSNQIIELLTLSSLASSSIKENDFISKSIFRKKIAERSSLLFVLSWGIVYFILAYTGSKLLFDYPLANVLISIFPVLFGLIIEYELASLVFSKAYQYLSNCNQTGKTQSFVSQIYPRATFILSMIGISTAILTFAPRAKITTDMVPGWEGIALACIITVSTISYKTSAILGLINRSMQFFTTHFTNEEDKAVAIAYQKLDGFIETLSKLDDSDLEILLDQTNLVTVLSNINPESQQAELINDYIILKRSKVNLLQFEEVEDNIHNMEKVKLLDEDKLDNTKDNTENIQSEIITKDKRNNSTLRLSELTQFWGKSGSKEMSKDTTNIITLNP